MPTVGHKVNYLPAYPEERRRRWQIEEERDAHRDLEWRIEDLELGLAVLAAAIERLKSDAA